MTSDSLVPPRWIIEPEDVSILENNVVKIPCHAYGMPLPIITWYKIQGIIKTLQDNHIIINE